MIAENSLPTVLYAAVNSLCMEGVVREDDLLLRWSFDEEVGSNSQNTIGVGLEAILDEGNKWESKPTERRNQDIRWI